MKTRQRRKKILQIIKMQNNTNTEINTEIIKERNNEMKELLIEMEILNSSWTSVSELIHFQSSSIDQASENIEKVVKDTEESKNSLEKSVGYARDRIIMIRDIAIVTGGGVLGLSGFLLGPFIGLGTMAAGLAGGGATVAGLHNSSRA